MDMVEILSRNRQIGVHPKFKTQTREVKRRYSLQIRDARKQVLNACEIAEILFRSQDALLERAVCF